MELRSCYFCGSTGRTLETRELVPTRPATDRPVPDADRASVVLCPDCDAKLDRVLDLVLDTTRNRSDASVAPSATGATAADAGFSTEITFDDAASGVDIADASDPDAADADDAHAADASGNTSPDAAGTGSGARAGVDVVGGPATTDGDETTDDGSGGADREDDGDPGEDAEDAADATDAEVVEGTADGDGSDDDGGSSGELRSLGESSAGTYRKALRLLQNREFPMARSDLVDVLSSAYDLDPGECERLVDFAVERGWLVADGDELRRG